MPAYTGIHCARRADSIQPGPPTPRRQNVPAVGQHRSARRFRYGLIAFDVVTICLFIVSSFAGEARWMIALDVVFAFVLSLELAARLYAENDRKAMLLSVATLADVVVILSLLLAAFAENLAFLRIARTLRLLRSYHLLRDLRAESRWFRLHEDIISAR